MATKAEIFAAAALLFSLVLLAQTPTTIEAVRWVPVLPPREPLCPACVCCTPPPPGSCCKCCASPLVPAVSVTP